eukprot:862690-Rhodomonas_salina.2
MSCHAKVRRNSTTSTTPSAATIAESFEIPGSTQPCAASAPGIAYRRLAGRSPTAWQPTLIMPLRNSVRLLAPSACQDWALPSAEHRATRPAHVRRSLPSLSK